jgi:NADH-quinone oxidoreductase subunit F
VAYNYMRGEFHHEPYEHFEAALKEAYAAGLLGKNIKGSGIDVDIYNALGAGAYICGEETALMDSLEGKKGKPRFKPPFPAGFGLYGKPTTINNTETYASVPAILRNGPDWFAGPGQAEELRRHEDLLGLRSRQQGGNFEIALGTPFKDCWKWPAACGTGPQAQGRDSGRLLDEGAAGRHHAESTMDYDSCRRPGSSILARAP